jgi:hypothetical protein
MHRLVDFICSERLSTNSLLEWRKNTAVTRGEVTAIQRMRETLILSVSTVANTVRGLALSYRSKTTVVSSLRHSDVVATCRTGHWWLWSPWTCSVLQVDLGDPSIASVSSRFLREEFSGFWWVEMAQFLFPSSFQTGGSGHSSHPVTMRFKKPSASVSQRRKSGYACNQVFSEALEDMHCPQRAKFYRNDMK